MGIFTETTKVNLVTPSYRRGVEPALFGTMSAPEAFYTDTLHTIAINTRETEFGSLVEPIPIMLKVPYQQFHPIGHTLNGYGYAPVIAPTTPATVTPEKPVASTAQIVKEDKKDTQKIARPPKKKWIKEYLEEEPKSPVSPVSAVSAVSAVSVSPVSPVSVRLAGVRNGVVRPTSPVPVPPAAPLEPAPAPALALAPAPAPVDFIQEHSRPRTTHGPPQIPSPPSVSSNGSSGSSGSAPRAGTREVHNKLEKNRRAHLKECFELLKRQLPVTPDDKKTSNLSILGSAIRYIQVLRRKERECEHEMERLAREKIAAQQRLATLRREVTVRAAVRPRTIDAVSEEKDRDDSVNGQVLGIPISITSSPPRSQVRMESPPHTLNLSTKLRTLPIQITPTTSQVVRTSYGTRHNTLTLTTIAPAEPTAQNGQENGINTLSNLVHPAQIHLPLSQVVSSGGLVVSPAALQLLSTSGLRVLQAPSIHTNGITTDSNKISKENGIVTPPPASTEGSVVVSGLTPLVVSQPAAHLLQTHTLTHKMVETQMVKGVTPLVSAQYVSTTIVKPVVVVSSAPPT